MTTQTATLRPTEADDTRAAQEARWIAWKTRGAADDRMTQRHMRIAFAVILIGFACVTIAMLL